MRDEAYEDLRQFAYAGRLGAGLNSLRVKPESPKPGDTVTVSWKVSDISSRPELSIQGQQLSVPPRDSYEFVMPDELVEIELAVGDDVETVLVTPKITKPRLVRFELAGSKAPKPGEDLAVEWHIKKSEDVKLKIKQGDQTLLEEMVPARGKRTVVPLSMESVVAVLEAMSTDVMNASELGRSVFVRKRNLSVSRPVVRSVEFPDVAYCGEQTCIRWQFSAAEAVSMQMRNGTSQSAIDNLSPTGKHVFVPREQGRVTIRLVATSEHAHLTDDATTTVVRSIEVKPPPLKLTLRSAETNVLAGAQVKVRWSITGTDQATLFVGERSAVVSGDGVCTVSMRARPVEVWLEAQSDDGVLHESNRILLEPMFFNAVWEGY